MLVKVLPLLHPPEVFPVWILDRHEGFVYLDGPDGFPLNPSGTESIDPLGGIRRATTRIWKDAAELPASL